MADKRASQRTQVIIQALEQTGQRAIVLSGWGGVETQDLPDTVFRVESVPHEWLFPRMSAIIHHGGAGTTVAAAKAGVPSMIIPFLGDQFFWGRRIAEAGIGPGPIPMRELTVDRLV
jgi:UDP:flavonoid glycosyltransferase YjiC (YdhE family)